MGTVDLDLAGLEAVAGESLDQCRLVEGHGHLAPVDGAEALALNRLVPNTGNERPHPVVDVAADLLAQEAPITQTGDGDEKRLARDPVEIEEIGPLRERIRGVEHERPEPVAVTDGVDLANLGSVGDPVEVELLYPEGLADRVDVVGRIGARVQVRRVTKGGGTGRHHLERGRQHGLRVRTIDRSGLPGSPDIDEQEVAPVEQRAEHVVEEPELGRRAAGASFDDDDRPERGCRLVSPGVQLERDRNRPGGRGLAVEWNIHESAQRALRLLATWRQRRTAARRGRQ